MGRRVALWTFIAAVALLGLAAWLLRDSIRERYLIHRLGSDDAEVRAEALERLVELASVRAVPAIIALKVRSRDVTYDPLLRIALARREEFLRAVGGVARRAGAERLHRCYALYLLSEICQDPELAAPAIEVADKDADPLVRECAATARRELERRQAAREARGKIGIGVVDGAREARGSLGILVEERDGGSALVIARPVDGMPAARIDLRPGNALARIDEREVRSLDDVAGALGGRRVGDVVTLVVRRQGADLVRPVILDNEASPWSALLPRALGE